MPIFEYRCSACDHLEEVLQKHSDPGPAVCPACGKKGSLAKEISATSFQLKGGGWYKDLYSSTKKDGSAGVSSAAAALASTSSSASTSASTAAKSESKSESKPAAPAKKDSSSGSSSGGGSSGSSSGGTSSTGGSSASSTAA